MEDAEASIILPILNSQLIWFHEAISEINRRLEDSYFCKNEKDENGRVEVSKFRPKNGWVLR